MNTISIILVILSALMHAFRDFFTKKAHDKQVFIWWYLAVALVLFLPAFIYYLIQETVVAKIYFLVAFIAGIIRVFYFMFLSKAYDKGELSHVYPIMRSSPALVLIFSIIFLKETVSFMGVLGIIIVAFGVYVINMKRITFNTLIEPIKAIITEKSTQFAFLTLIMVTAYTLVDKIGVNNIHPLIYLYFYSFVTFVFLTPYIFKVKQRSTILEEWIKNKKEILIAGSIVLTGYLFILIAFTLDNVSYVVGLRQLSIVFAVLLGGHILKENHKFIRLFASLLIFVGAFLITIAK